MGYKPGLGVQLKQWVRITVELGQVAAILGRRSFGSSTARATSKNPRLGRFAGADAAAHLDAKPKVEGAERRDQ